MKKIILAVSAIATVIVIGTCYYGYQKFNNAMSEVTNVNILKDSWLGLYKKDNLSGWDVKALLELSYSHDVIVSVKTLGAKEFVDYTENKPYKIQDTNNNDYLEETGDFSINFETNKKGEVIKIIIEQK